MKKFFAALAAAFFLQAAFGMPWASELDIDGKSGELAAFFVQGDYGIVNGKVYGQKGGASEVSVCFASSADCPDCLTIVSRIVSDVASHPGRASKDEKVKVSLWKNGRSFSFEGINRAEFNFKNQVVVDVFSKALLNILRQDESWALMVQGEGWHLCTKIGGNLPQFAKAGL